MRDDAGRPETQPFLIDIRGPHDRAGVDGADVVPVRARGTEANQLAVEKDRPDRRHVMQVRALHVTVVHDEDVALGDVVVVIVHHMVDIGIDRTDEERYAARLTQHIAVRVEERDGAVPALVDDRRVGGTPQRGVHVLRAGNNEVAHDLGRDGVCRVAQNRIVHDPASSVMEM